MISQEVNKNRRKFIKFALIGGGVLLAGKIFGPKLLDVLSPSPKVEKDFVNFKVSEDKSGLKISDKSGEEIFIIDKGQ